MVNTIKETVYFHTSATGYYNFCSSLQTIIDNKMDDLQTPVFLCIGSDRITGDCLGPLVGHKLKHDFKTNNCIYGTLEQPAHAGNLVSITDLIYAQHKNPFLIAIDASLGTSGHIGQITLSPDGLSPGKGLKKNLPFVGDISITGIVNYYNGNSSVTLQNTRLHLVNQLSEFIYMGITQVFSCYLTR